MKQQLLLIAAVFLILAGSGCYKKENVPSANFSFSRNDSIVPDTVTFHNLSQNASSYLWNFGDNSSSSATNPVHIYKDTITMTYTVTLKAYSKSGEQWAIKTTDIYVQYKR